MTDQSGRTPSRSTNEPESARDVLRDHMHDVLYCLICEHAAVCTHEEVVRNGGRDGDWRGYCKDCGLGFEDKVVRVWQPTDPGMTPARTPS